jgi:transposase-like protein
MANVLSNDKKIAVISGLSEGMAIRQIERVTNIHRDTIMRLGVKSVQASIIEEMKNKRNAG